MFYFSEPAEGNGAWFWSTRLENLSFVVLLGPTRGSAGLTLDAEFCLCRDVLVLVGGRAAVGAGVVVGDGSDDQVTAC